MQLNSVLFAKTLIRKNVALGDETNQNGQEQDEGDLSGKAQVMTLMTTDVDRVGDFAWNLFSLIGLSEYKS